ncbi:MAG: hypothetical protein NVS2B14_01210 [Chamaesiphon sp.]
MNLNYHQEENLRSHLSLRITASQLEMLKRQSAIQKIGYTQYAREILAASLEELEDHHESPPATARG